jgi:hypothetical protein
MKGDVFGMANMRLNNEHIEEEEPQDGNDEDRRQHHVHCYKRSEVG